MFRAYRHHGFDAGYPAALQETRTIDFRGGDVGYVPQSLPHFIENTGDTDLVFLEMFKAPRYEDVALGQWISHLPPALVEAHLHLGEKVMISIARDKLVITPT